MQITPSQLLDEESSGDEADEHAEERVLLEVWTSNASGRYWSRGWDGEGAIGCGSSRTASAGPGGCDGTCQAA